MTVSTKGRYALRVMLDLAQQDPAEYISLKVISQRQEISMKYLEMIVSILNRAGFVTSMRGKGGGYMLTGSAGSYTVGSIIKLAEGSLAPVTCLEHGTNNCGRMDNCLTLPMWAKLGEVIDDYLESVTLEDLLKNRAQTPSEHDDL